MDEPIIKPLVDPHNEGPPESLLDQLAARSREIADTKETYFPVPGYDKEPPMLYIKYRLLDGKVLDKIGRKIAQDFVDRWDRTLFAGVDTIIAACSGLYYSEEQGEKKPLTIGGEPVLGFTAAFAEAMKFAEKLADPNNPRNVVLGLFNFNDASITQHIFILNRWMTDTTFDVTQASLGNL